MCGFVLLLSADDGRPAPGQAEAMAQFIAHRGPDDAGSLTENGLSLAFRRLAIFDLAESSHQPMVSADGRHVIVFNGAIYNFIELRAELGALGHTFRTTGDTEVLLAAYQQWGVECLPRLNGMWAFAIYDRQSRRVFAARDRFGVKPLFWHHDKRGLVLTSEIKAIRDSGYTSLKPNWSVIADFLLTHEIDAAHDSFYADIGRVPPGTFFESDGRAEPAFRRYWTLEGVSAAARDGPDPIEAFRHLFEDAVRLRMRSDVPVGVLLSGGLDSTSIIATMASQAQSSGGSRVRLDALCYSDPAYDERSFIDATLEQTGATLCLLEPNQEQLWDSLEKHLWHQDEPVHSFTSVVIYQLMQMARARGLKVMLNGQGADEVLAGYPSFFLDYWSDLVRAGELRRAHREIRDFAQGHNQTSFALQRAVAANVLKQLRRRVPGHANLAARRRRAQIDKDPWVSADVKSYWKPRVEPHSWTLTDALRSSVERSSLPLYLRVEDRNSMAHAVEVRLPFLDHRLVTQSFQLASHWKLRGEFTKVILREAMRGRIPDVVRQRVTKYGFPTSANDWFRDRLYERCRDLLAGQRVRESGIWNVPELQRSLDGHKQSGGSAGHRLFDVVQFTMWCAL